MAEALDQTVETVETPSDTSSNAPGKDAPATQNGDGAKAGVVPEPAPEAASAPKSEPTPKPTPEPAPEPAALEAAAAATGGRSNGIPLAERITQPPADTASHPPATLKNRYLIFPAMPLTDLDSPTALAYGVEDRREPGRQLFALVCTPGLPVRTRTMATLRNATIGGMIPLVDSGPVLWGPLGQTCEAVILERPMGGRFLDAFGDNPVKITEYELGKRLLEPVAQAITDLSGAGLTHRAIRLDNMYFMDKERRELVLGECVTSPPGFDQPLIYEPRERAMALPAGRGYGDSEDDVYALGIVMVFLLLGYNPVSKVAGEALLLGKAERGTYQCLCGNERIPLSMIEPLRGLLSDDPHLRWTVGALTDWLNGQKKTPIQLQPPPKPKTAFKFAGFEHRSPLTLAHMFAKNVSDAAKVIKSGKVELWLRQSLGLTDLADSLTAAITVTKVHEGSPDGSDDVLVTKVIMRLDPQGPIRYKGFSFSADGFGPALALEYLRKGSYQIPAEILARDLLGFWFAAQGTAVNPELAAMDRTFQTLRSFAKINELGYGMERCLYELNRDLPCQSEILQRAYIDHIDDLLGALDAAADHVDTRSRPMDKHIAAFIATHFKYDIQPHLKAMSDEHEETSLIGMLSLFALIQWRAGGEPLFGLSSWLGGLLQPAIGTYHSRTTRRTIETEIPALVRQGSLPELFDLIDNAERRKTDNDEFEEAQVAFAHAEQEIQTLVGEDVDQEKVALATGEKTTAMIAVVMGMIATTMIIFAYTV